MPRAVKTEAPRASEKSAETSMAMAATGMCRVASVSRQKEWLETETAAEHSSKCELQHLQEALSLSLKPKCETPKGLARKDQTRKPKTLNLQLKAATSKPKAERLETGTWKA